MNTPKNILIVFPHNFFELKSGVHKRYIEFVRYLKEQGFSIDLLGLKHFESTWNNFDHENSNKLINHLFLYNFRLGYNKYRLWSFLSSLNFISKKRKSKADFQLFDYAFPGMISLLNKILVKKKYDFIIIGYIYWANLLKEIKVHGVLKVLTIEDFISQKLYENRQGPLILEKLINEEVNRVNLFDKVICLSHEELRFFSGNASHPEYFFVPVFMDQPKLVTREKEYDILFIGYDNEDNRTGLQWFFEKVYPLLKSDIKIIVIGKISLYAPELPNVHRTEYIPDLGEIYAKSKISINPLQTGTGMKVKVVESIAHGIPVVNTSKGLCGMPPDILNQFIIADDPQSFANEINNLLSDPVWYDQKCNEAIKTFRNNFDAFVAKKELDKIFLL